MSSALEQALKQATELVGVVNKMIPEAEKLVNTGLSESMKTLKGQELKDAQKYLFNIKTLTNQAKKGEDVSKKVNTLIKEVKAKYNK